MSGKHEHISKIGEFLNDHRAMAIGAAATGLALTLAQVESVVVNSHGDVSHRANSQSDKLKWANDHLMWLLGTDAVSWASAHVGDVEVDGQREGIMHHGMTDANIFPAYEVERYLRTIEADPVKYADYPRLPDDKPIPNLDPSAQFTAQEVRRIGTFGYKIMDEVLGEDHKPPEAYTLDEASKIMDFSQPRYHYEPAKNHPDKEDYTQDQIAKILMADPYSPVLEPLNERTKNGPRALNKNNVTRFRAPAKLFKRHPEYLRPMLRDVENKSPENKLGPIVLFGGSILAFTLARASRRGLNIDTVATGALAGASAAALGIIGPVEGGKKVNGWGHAGRMTMKDLWRTWRNKPYELIPDHDGSYMTKLADDHGLKKAASRIGDTAFAGELFGQPPHHAHPGNRLYSFKEGFRAFIDNPATFTIRALANHSLLGLRPAVGFDLKEGERRPDEPNSIITDVIQPARVRTVYPDIYAKHHAGS